MSDESHTEPPRVGGTPPRNAAYWARYFQVPVEHVDEAVAAVGHDPARVAAYLKKSWPNPESGIV